MSLLHNYIDKHEDETVSQFDNRINSIKNVHAGYVFISENDIDFYKKCMGIYIVWNGELNSKLVFKLPATGYAVKGEAKNLIKLSSVSFGIPLIANIKSTLGQIFLDDFYFTYEGVKYEVEYYGIHVKMPDELCFRSLKLKEVDYNTNNDACSSFSFKEVKHTSITKLVDSSFSFKLINNNSYVFNMNSYFSSSNWILSSSYKNSSFIGRFEHSSYTAYFSSSGLGTNSFNGSFQNNFNYFLIDNPSSYDDEQDLNFMYKIYSKYFDELSERFGIGFSGYGLDLL